MAEADPPNGQTSTIERSNGNRPIYAYFRAVEEDMETHENESLVPDDFVGQLGRLQRTMDQGFRLLIQQTERTNDKLDGAIKDIRKNSEDIQKNSEDIQKNSEDIQKISEAIQYLKKLIGLNDINAAARNFNASIRTTTANLLPLLNAAGHRCQNFPATIATFNQLDEEHITSLLKQFKLPVDGDVTHKRTRLKVYCGVPFL